MRSFGDSPYWNLDEKPAGTLSRSDSLNFSMYTAYDSLSLLQTETLSGVNISLEPVSLVVTMHVLWSPANLGLPILCLYEFYD